MELGVIFSGLAFLAALVLWKKYQQLGQSVQLWRFSIVEVALVGLFVALSIPNWVYYVVGACIVAVVVSLQLATQFEHDWDSVSFAAATSLTVGYIVPVVLLAGLPWPPYTALFWVIPCLVLTYTRLGDPCRRAFRFLGWI